MINEAPKWYQKYNKMPSILFNYEASGARHHLPPPYQAEYDRDFNTKQILGKYGMDEEWTVIGYSETVANRPRLDSVGIMFESTDDFERIWWHYLRD